jgi:acetylornithine/succinyldiaminopimelate/putrescine aminotransferase
VDIGPQALIDFYQGRTGLEAQRLIASYIGKWTKLTGNIDDIQQVRGRGIHVGFQLTPHSSAVLLFDFDWLDRLSVLPPHQRISALCQIDTVGASGASFVNCKLDDHH